MCKGLVRPLSVGLALPRLFALLALLAPSACVDLGRPAALGGAVTPTQRDGGDAAGPKDGPRQDTAAPGDVGRDSGDAGGDAPQVLPDGPPDPPDAAPDSDPPPVDTAPEEVPPGKLALGSACTTGDQCASTNCVDGVCCNSACTGGCQACNQSGSCLPVADGADPRNACPAEGATCGRVGGCNGAGACKLRAAGTACGTRACTSAREISSSCNGQGSCVAGAPRSCGNYQCGADRCLTGCTVSTQCRADLICTGGACNAPPPPDAGPPDTAGAGLLVDDFQDADNTRNLLGGLVSVDNQTFNLVSGKQRFVWNGSGAFQDYLQSFRANWCEYDLSPYSKLSFKLRASAASKRLAVILLIGTGGCATSGENRISTITPTTAEATYEFDISRVARTGVLALELQPLSLDGTEYFLDDIRLLP